MKKLQEIDRLVEEAFIELGIVTRTAKDKYALTKLARKCAEINIEDFCSIHNYSVGGNIDTYNSRLRDGKVEEVKQEEKPALQPLPEEMPDWFNTFNGAYLKYNEIRQHFGTQPREWWQDLKKGDKFMCDNESWVFNEMALCTDDERGFYLSECSPYTNPTQSFREKLTPEMQVEFDKVVSSLTHNTKKP